MTSPWTLSREGRIDVLHVFKWHGTSYVHAGELTFEGTTPKRIGRFRYADSYRAREDKRAIDPINLPLGKKSYLAAPDEAHGAFQDSGPDGWGRNVLARAFPGRHLGAAEMLALGTSRRTGDLAYGPTPDGPLEWKPGGAAVGTMGRQDDLADLLLAAGALEDYDETRRQLDLLVWSSSDLGGARPKARVHLDGMDWIAKFPARDDRFDEARVEAAYLDVAEDSGLPTPRRRLSTVNGKAVLLVARFDRDPEGRPLPYLSAATALNEEHNAQRTRKTYTDIAEVARSGLGIQAASTKVFHRLLLNAHLANTDDHLRNMGFVDGGRGWDLSPVFDLVPHIGKREHVAPPAPDFGYGLNVEAAFASHDAFRIPVDEARTLRDRVVQAVARLPVMMAARGVTAEHRDLVLAELAKPGDPEAFPQPGRGVKAGRPRRPRRRNEGGVGID